VRKPSTANTSSRLDYDPFGMMLIGRSWSPGSEYRYGFNGKESDPETYGDGNIYDYGFRIYNPRLGKFLSVDPLTPSYPEWSPYAFAMNQPIWANDIDGLEKFVVTSAGFTATDTEILIVTLEDVTASFQVYDSRDGTTNNFFLTANIQRSLGDAYYDVDGGVLRTPSLVTEDGKDWFYNPNGQGPGQDATPLFSAVFLDEGTTPTHLETTFVEHTSISRIENMNTPDDPAPLAVNIYNIAVPGSSTNTTLSFSYQDYAGVGNTFTIADPTTGATLIPTDPITGSLILGPLSGEGYADYNVTGFTSIQVIVIAPEPGFVGDQYSATLQFDYSGLETVTTVVPDF